MAEALVTSGLVLCCAGMLLGLNFTEWREHSSLRSARRTFEQACEAARARAVASRQVQRLRFDAERGELILEEETGAAGNPGDFERVDSARLRGADSPVWVEVDEASPGTSDGISPSNTSPQATLPTTASHTSGSFCFYPEGTADAGEVRLFDRRGSALCLRINPYSGSAEIRSPGAG